MFKKPFKVKSYTQVKNSEIKLIKSQVLSSFPTLTQGDLDHIIHKKETLFCMKAICANNKLVSIYFIQKRPIFILLDSTLLPTVYLLWQYPQITITFTTTPFVVSKIKSGADLMLPGILQTPDMFNDFQANDVACVNSSENKVAIAVGLTSVSSYDIKSNSLQKGKCVVICHFYGDELCCADDMAILPLPELGLPDCILIQLRTDIVINENQEVRLEQFTNSQISDEEKEEAEENPVDDVENMDKLLEFCLLLALKYTKNLQLPILTSTFYKLHMLNACPSGKQLDVKKSSYKKVGQFLKKMMQDGIITVKEQKKGAESITLVNHQHPTLMNFYASAEYRPKKADRQDSEKMGPNIVEEYLITANVLPLFANTGLTKGDRLPASTIRKYVTEFVKKHNCQDETNKGLVKIENPHLAVICKNSDVVTWEMLTENVFKLMKPYYKVVTGEEEKIAKGKIQPINIVVETRTGNKKVTLVDNLELFGIRITEFAKECQHGVAASATINKPPGKKCEQLLIQGNQVLYIYNHLIDKYKIPKKYIKGLEYAPKTKK